MIGTSASVLTAELRGGIAADAVVDDVDILEGYRRDRLPNGAAGRPAALVRATREADVQHALRVARRAGVQVIPRGAGSGLSGGANAVDGCIMLSLERMNRVIRVDPTEQVAVVEAGVLNGDLDAVLASEGLWFPPDPASAAFSTIGGNIATNAGGLCCLKYGVTRDWVVSVRAVLADGSVVETRRPTRKDAAGYDLTGLLVGSEGTLGVVTEATVRTRPLPGPRSTMAAFFPSLGAAGEAVGAVMRSGVAPTILELMDAPTIAAVDEWKRMELDREAAALLVAQSDAPGEVRHDEVAAMGRLAEAAGASFVAVTDDREEGEWLLAARRLAYPALERLGATLLDDIGVPIGRIPDMLAAAHRLAVEHGVRLATFGHAGDGNLHPTFVFDPNDDDERDRVGAAFVAVVEAALDLGGTATGEHGVGTLKTRFLERQVGPVAMALNRSIKRAIDPEGRFRDIMAPLGSRGHERSYR